MLPLVIYLALSLLVGFLGRQTRIGFMGAFALSLLLTPLIMAVILIVGGPARKADAGGTAASRGSRRA